MKPTRARGKSIFFRPSLFGIVFLATTGCGATPQADTRTAVPFELELETLTGERMSLNANRGQAVFLCVFASFDPTSQHMLTMLTRFSEERPDILVLGVNVEPNASELTPILRDAMHIPFALLIDPSGAISRGESALETLAAVPSLYFVDAEGNLRGVRVGALTRQELHEAAALLSSR